MRTPMTVVLICLVVAACVGEPEASAGPTLSRQAPEDSSAERVGYVLRPNEGEILGQDIIKASPSSGTQGSVLITSALSDGFSSGFHTHLEADELFYVIDGRGMISMGGEEYIVEAGFVAFVPAGTDHRIHVEEGGSVEVLEFLDEPGLDEEFRAWHRRMSEDPTPLTLEEVNEISRQYGTVYRTLE